MVEKKILTFYCVIASCFIFLMTLTTMLLCIEYRFFCRQIDELSALKKQYAGMINVLQKKMDDTSGYTYQENNSSDDGNNRDDYDVIPAEIEESLLVIEDIIAAENSDAPDNDDEYADDSFMVINRHPEYLKQSTIDYIQSQELNTLMTAIDIDRWSDYTEFVESSARINSEKSPKINNNNRTIPKVSSTVQQKKITKAVVPRRPIKDHGFVWPIDNDKFWLSSLFGPRKRLNGSWGFHHGIDMAAVKGTAVKSARSGDVIEASFQQGYGNTVLVQHNSNLKTRYAHLNTICVSIGQKIKQGTIVGTVGETGFIRKKGKDGSHLHFEIYEHGKRINPMNCLPSIR
jgi:murein DD-endopeptidase MepM/ murein hydrolase activator NlpD